MRHESLGVSMQRRRVIEKEELQRNLNAWRLSERDRKVRFAIKKQATTLGQSCPDLAALQQRMKEVGV